MGAIPLSLLLPWIIVKLNLGGAAEDVSWMSVAVYDDLLLQRFFKVFLIIAVVWTGVTNRWYARQENPIPEIQETTNTQDNPQIVEVPTQSTPAFLEKMTKPIGRIPWAIKAEQHYIRIYTQEGDEMVLYRFSDAIKSLEGHDGLQVHRSYWVAAEAIEKIEPSGKSYEITLKNGIKVPVSRSNKKQVDALRTTIVS
jgi:hypothetical protein